MSDQVLLDLPLISESAASHGNANALFNVLASLSVLTVISRTTTAEPASPSDGDAYLLPTSGCTGTNWAGNDGKIAVYYSGWYFVDVNTKNVRSHVYVDDEKLDLYYSEQENEWFCPYGIGSDSTEWWTGRYYSSAKIYRKKVALTGLASASGNDPHAHGISTPDLTKPFLCIAASIDNGTNVLVLPYIDSGNTARIGLVLTTTNIVLATSFDISAYAGWTLLEYCKT